MTSNFPDANGAFRWETCDSGCPFLLETLSKIGISKFRSSCQRLPSLTSQKTKLENDCNFKERQEIWPTCLNEPWCRREAPEGWSFSCRKSNGSGGRGKVADGWDEHRAALLHGSPQLEYWTTINFLQSCSWTLCHRFLGPALEDYLISSLIH